MLGFNFKIQYKSGCENKASDTLSQNPRFEEEIKMISATQVIRIEGVNSEVVGHEKLRGIVQDLL